MALAGVSARLVYLRGSGAERCPSEAVVRGAVGARLGYDPFLGDARDSLFVEIQRRGHAFHIVAKLIDSNNLPRGARDMVVPGDDCSVAIDALGLSLSLTLDPTSIFGARAAPDTSDRRDAAPQPPAPSSPTPAAEPGPVPVIAAAPAPAAPPPARAAVQVSGGAIGSFHAAPSATAGATLSVGLAWRTWSVDLEARADAPTTGESGSAPITVRSWIVAGSLVPCGHAGFAYGCVEVGAGMLGATARNVAVPFVSYAPWVATGARAGVEAPVAPRWWLRAYVQVLATLTRDTLWVDGTLAYTVPRWSAGLGLALAWRSR